MEASRPAEALAHVLQNTSDTYCMATFSSLPFLCFLFVSPLDIRRAGKGIDKKERNRPELKNMHSDHSSSGSSASSDSEEFQDSNRSRKRQRLSPPSEEDHVTSVPVVKIQSSRILSRVKARIPATPILAQAVVKESILDQPNLPSSSDKSTFTSLQVQPWLVSTLSTMAITRPTAIQKGCIPEILSGRDCIGGSRTGSGKTMAFAIPILQKWAEDPIGIYAVILTPTR